MTEESRRKYRSSLGFVEQGFRSCWKNANDLTQAAKLLLDAQFHAPALSLSVLAIEELAKLYAIDGLLYARSGDHKDHAFREATKSHQAKLAMFELFPLLLGNLAQMHPKYSVEQRFNIAVAMSIQHLKDDGNAVMSYLQKGAFSRLDTSKQMGFYVHNEDSQLLAPAEAIDPAFAQLVYRLAWRATTTLDFLLKDGHLERYITNARALRSKLTEQEHQKLERTGMDKFREIFGIEDDNDA